MLITNLIKYKIFYLKNFILKREPNEIIRKTKKYAFLKHQSVLQMYDDKPYIVHPFHVYDIALKYNYVFYLHNVSSFDYGFQNNQITLQTALLHDTIEDTNITHNDLKKVFGEDVANNVYNLTNNKGRNRNERADDSYYNGIKTSDISVFVKLCDRIANVSSNTSKNGMLDKYKKEYKHFKEKLYTEKFKDLFDEIERLINY